VVTKDVPDFAIVVGNPARVLRYRFAEEIRHALRRISWWDWSHEKLRETLPEFRALPIEAFCARHDPG
jgi:serine acetyltransferase